MTCCTSLRQIIRRQAVLVGTSVHAVPSGVIPNKKSSRLSGGSTSELSTSRPRRAPHAGREHILIGSRRAQAVFRRRRSHERRQTRRGARLTLDAAGLHRIRSCIASLTFRRSSCDVAEKPSWAIHTARGLRARQKKFPWFTLFAFRLPSEALVHPRTACSADATGVLRREKSWQALVTLGGLRGRPEAGGAGSTAVGLRRLVLKVPTRAGRAFCCPSTFREGPGKACFARLRGLLVREISRLAINALILSSLTARRALKRQPRLPSLNIFGLVHPCAGRTPCGPVARHPLEQVDHVRILQLKLAKEL
mmetsp:Transcript_62484/g.167335  ORF Transcript_62484/g.167335 Transcript_62484/m.167335 type:complete len:308 (+) Transcript_62484:1857-2780(+)